MRVKIVRLAKTVPSIGANVVFVERSDFALEN